MPQDFDHIAEAYDTDFTHSLTGSAQRAQVWKQLLPLTKGQVCLELNCGTGEDAQRFCELGLQVTATDISPGMVTVARSKIAKLGGDAQVLDINHLQKTHLEQVQLLFSNFGGLNCLSATSWKDFAATLAQSLPGKARVVLVIMGRKCLWEQLYFFAKRKQPWSRKGHQAVMAHVDGVEVPTWYYSPTEIISFLKGSFEVVKTRPIGFFVPPSYLEPFVQKRKGLFALLRALDRITANWSLFANRADHFYIELLKKEA